MNHRAQRRRRSGFSLVELLLSLVFAAIAVGGLASFVEIGLGTSRSTLIRASLDAKAARALDAISHALQFADRGSISVTEVPPLSRERVRFRRASGQVAGQIVWEPVSSIELRPSPSDPPNGLDDDGNGLIDDHEVILVESVGLPEARERVLVRGVARYLQGEQANALDDNGNDLVDEAGLCFTRVDGAIQIRLTLLANQGGSTVQVHTVETTVRSRN